MPLRLGLRVTRRIYRQGMTRALGAIEGLSVVGATESFTELLLLAQTKPLDCVVLEVHRDERCARDAIAAMRQAHPAVRIVALHELDRFELHRLKKAGANATADRCDGIDGLIMAITGATVVERSVRSEREPELPRTLARLTPREREVLQLVSTGLTSRAISLHLAVSQKTVENHKQRIFHKLDVQNQGHAVAVALRLGLLAAFPERPERLDERRFDESVPAIAQLA